MAILLTYMKDGKLGIKPGFDIDLRHLRYFVTVAKEKSISRAARKLFTSQPSLGRQIRDLESRLGFSLFDRKNRSFSLTTAGIVLFEDSRRLLHRWEEWKQDVADEAERPPERFRLVVSEYLAGSTAFAEYLRALQRSSGQVPIEVIDRPEEPSVAEILEGEYDFTLSLLKPEHRNVASLKIGKTRLCAYLPAGHPLAENETVDLDSVARLPLVQCDPGNYPQVHGMIEEFFQQNGLEPNVEFEVSRVSTAFDLVSSGAACFLNFGLGYQSLGRDFVCRPIENGPRAHVYLNWLRERIERTACDLVRSLNEAEQGRFDSSRSRIHEEIELSS